MWIEWGDQKEPSRFIYNRILSFIIRFYSLACFLWFFLLLPCFLHKKEREKLKEWAFWEATQNRLRFYVECITLTKKISKVQHTKYRNRFFSFIFNLFCTHPACMGKVNSLFFMDAPYVHFFVSYQEFHFAC